MTRALIALAALSLLAAGCSASASPTPYLVPLSAAPSLASSAAPTAALSPATSVAPSAISSNSARPTLIPVAVTGSLNGSTYTNTAWGVSLSLPGVYTYTPLVALKSPVTGLVTEETSGSTTDGSTGGCSFGAAIMPGLTESGFSALMSNSSSAITWSPLASVTLGGRAALRLDGTDAALGGALLTYVAFPGSGQLLTLWSFKAAEAQAWVASIVITGPK